MKCEDILAEVLQSKKYCMLDRSLVKRITKEAIQGTRSSREAIKQAKTKLHQISTVFGGYISYEVQTQNFLKAIETQDTTMITACCQDILRLHTSTRERLPFIEHFYATLLHDITPIQSVLDVGCGLHPFAFPYMRLAEHATYTAYDIPTDMMHCIATCLEQTTIRIHADTRDIIQDTPVETVDVAFLLKLVPTLDQQDKHASRRLLEHIQAQHFIVSFPIRSLGGKDKRMEAYYTQRMETLIKEMDCTVERFTFPNELVFRLSR